MRLLPSLGKVLLVLLLSSGVAAAATREVHRFYGYAFDQATGRYLYTEVHRHVFEDDRWISGAVRYYGPDNVLIADKTLDFSKDPLIPLFHMTFPRENYEEGITSISPGGVELERTEGGKRERTHLDREPGMVADAGFHNFVVQHLEDLRQDRTVNFNFAVAGRLSWYRFRLKRLGEITLPDGHQALRIRVEPDSLLRFIVPPLMLVYDLQNQHLVEYVGISNLHDPATGKPYPAVRIVFPAQAPAGAPATLPPEIN